MRSVLNALEVVERLGRDGPLGVGELARRTGLAKSTAQRCLDTLATAGWIERASGDAADVTGSRWQLSDRFRTITSDPLAALVARARPVLAELATQVGESVHLVRLDGTDVELLHREAGPGFIQVVIPDGFRVPAYAAATGKAMLAALDPVELGDHLPDHLRELTPATVASRRRLDDELDVLRSRGYAENDGEWNESVAAIAASVTVVGRPIAAVSISGTPGSLDASRRRELAPLAIHCAHVLSAT